MDGSLASKNRERFGERLRPILSSVLLSSDISCIGFQSEALPRTAMDGLVDKEME
jgi:hypothetical protein